MMKKVFIFIILFINILIFACGRKQDSEELEPLTMEELTAIETQEESVASTKPDKIIPDLKPLPPSGPYRPTGRQIQTALKNANYYKDKIDGIIGPKTKQAIKEFQKAHGLKVDGIVGPLTWEELKKYLD